MPSQRYTQLRNNAALYYSIEQNLYSLSWTQKVRLGRSQLMAMVTWTKKKFKQIYQYRTKGTYCDYMGDYRKIKKQHSFRRQQLACSAQSAQMGGYFSLSTTGPSKGVLFFNFFMVSHVATICTFGPILVDLLELFFGPNNHCHEL